MKYSFALASLIAVAAAQSGSSPIPECAQKCLADATSSATSCKLGDYACTCEPANKAAISAAASSCVLAACGADTALNQVLPASDKLCAEAAAGGGAASSAPAAASSAAAATSAAASSASYHSSAAASHAATTATSHAAATSTANATATTTTPVQAGAAGVAPFGGLAMLLLGALAI
ncbi:CFEM domain-containing protein [Colletotrichum graminicola]|uniref:CFEM domain-containing protein n=1 Tax=Colletotrichum graminicola (strain M1.001 / M2 / FGSC 10212) TaxID=645133 RepID=E3Q595_COLGM|nr:CFEM domain-containing protein [Colletotrichum graminicola M1.001]EFQ25862.1 CFEM domain-containing protein [Colletotrichum graminicola M1.001]WDK22974.1 CFEM domain-containing protein [Colletotrichum graminicola]